MKSCPDRLEALLEAEPAELRGIGENEVARHVRDCTGCAQEAERILQRTAELDHALSAHAGVLDADALIDAALAGVGTKPRQHRWSWVTGMAAAAALVGLLLVPRGGPTIEQATSLDLPMAMLPTVEAAPGQNVAVIQTGNPDITVLWFF